MTSFQGGYPKNPKSKKQVYSFIVESDGHVLVGKARKFLSPKNDWGVKDKQDKDILVQIYIYLYTFCER